jgi:hypothetical protein
MMPLEEENSHFQCLNKRNIGDLTEPAHPRFQPKNGDFLTTYSMAEDKKKGCSRLHSKYLRIRFSLDLYLYLLIN